jgi:hypothetical protein
MPRDIDSPDDREKPPFFDRKKETETSFWRLKRASDGWRENRLKRVMAQEEESLLTTLGRVSYICACLYFDGVILTEIPVSMGKTTFSWFLYFFVLAVAFSLQSRLYSRWFVVDIRQIDFNRPL